MNLERGRTHLHALHASIEADPPSAAIIKRCHIVTLVPQDLNDAIDLTKPVKCENLKDLNRLLAAFSLPPCEAYGHTNSQKISRAVAIPNEQLHEA